MTVFDILGNLGRMVQTGSQRRRWDTVYKLNTLCWCCLLEQGLRILRKDRRDLSALRGTVGNDGLRSG